MAALSLAGITGIYLRQVKQTGVLGLHRIPHLRRRLPLMLSTEVIGLVVIPSIARQLPRLRQRRPRRGNRRPSRPATSA